MRFSKSKRSAVILSAATVLAFSITDAVVNLVIPYLISRDIRTILANPEALTNPGSVAGLFLFLVFILIALIAVGAFWLDRFFGDRYFGEQSLKRWILFGFLFALFLKLPEWIFPTGWMILRAVLQFIGLFAAFFLARWLVPLQVDSSKSP